MARVKHASKQKRKTKTVTALGAAGLGLSLVGGASASTVPNANVPQADGEEPERAPSQDEPPFLSSATR